MTDSTGKALPASEKNAAGEGTMAHDISMNRSLIDSLMYSERVTCSLAVTDALKDYITHDRIKDKTCRTAWISTPEGAVFVSASRGGVNITGISLVYKPEAAYIKFFLRNNEHFYLYDVPFTQTIIQ